MTRDLRVDVSESRRPTNELPQAYPLERGELAYLTDADEPTRHVLSHEAWSPDKGMFGRPGMSDADLATLRVKLVRALTRVEDEMDSRQLLGRVTPKAVAA